MKIILTLITALAISTTASAQITPGSYVVGGAAGLNFSNAPNGFSTSRTTSFYITPNVGKFVSEKYLLSGGIGYARYSQFSQNNPSYSNKSTGNSFSAQFGVTRYFPLVDRLYFTLGGSLIPAYTVNRNELTNQGGTASTSSSEMFSAMIDITPGLTYFVNRKWMLYTSVGVLNYQLSHNLTSDQTWHTVSMSARGNSFGVGVRYIIGSGTND
ncbi:MAG: hypothetical protein AB8B56_09575 [Crocinitomicaceae bacterium]